MNASSFNPRNPKSDNEPVTFARTQDIELALTVKIISLEGNIPLSRERERERRRLEQEEKDAAARGERSGGHASSERQSKRRWGTRYIGLPSDLYVHVQLWADNKPLTSGFWTRHKPASANASAGYWSENGVGAEAALDPDKPRGSSSYLFSHQISLPIAYRSLPLSTQLTFTVWDAARPGAEEQTEEEQTVPGGLYDANGQILDQAVVVGGTTLPLFGKKRTLKGGQHRLYVHLGQRADGSKHTQTPSKVPLQSTSSTSPVSRPTSAAMPDGALSPAPSAAGGKRKTDVQEIRIPGGRKTDVEDSDLVAGRLEKLLKKVRSGELDQGDWLVKLASREAAKILTAASEKSERLFLYVDLPMFDFPVVHTDHEYPPPLLHYSIPSSLIHVTPPGQAAQSSSMSAYTSDSRLFTIVDPEMGRDNPVEAKHRKLVRSHRSGPLELAKELKPEVATRTELQRIIRYPPTQPLTHDEQHLVWRFRYYLSSIPGALTKFLKSVVWSDPTEVKQTVDELLPIWTEIDLADALEMLGPGDAFRHRSVRAHAVRRLAKADDDDLMLYLLQLVQALKFESVEATSSKSRRKHQTTVMQRRVTNTMTLEDFLIERSAANPVLGNLFYWYLMVECSDQSRGNGYNLVVYRFRQRLSEAPDGEQQLQTLKRQGVFVQELTKLAREIKASKASRPEKIAYLKRRIESAADLRSFDPLPLPLDASKTVIGIDAAACNIFKSNLLPLKLDLVLAPSLSQSQSTSGIGSPTVSVTSKPHLFSVIFKDGDDLRQDQLVLQLFTLMERLLQSENRNLDLIPYKVLATGATTGMVQFVKSQTLGDITLGRGTVLSYLRANSPAAEGEDASDTYGIDRKAFNTYVNSCAGYCVVTYLLGVGDRHLDNLMLSPDGHFFHVDFGYILGADPWGTAPIVKVCIEMIDGMGGENSEHYRRFVTTATAAFSALRKHANLLLNLVALMIDTSLPGFAVEPDMAVRKVQAKFMLELSEDEALARFHQHMTDRRIRDAFQDYFHRVAQAWRS